MHARSTTDVYVCISIEGTTSVVYLCMCVSRGQERNRRKKEALGTTIHVCVAFGVMLFSPLPLGFLHTWTFIVYLCLAPLSLLSPPSSDHFYFDSTICLFLSSHSLWVRVEISWFLPLDKFLMICGLSAHTHTHTISTQTHADTLTAIY